MDPHKLAERHTVKELVTMMQKAETDQANRNPQGSFAIMNKKGKKIMDTYAWAITYRKCADKNETFQAATFNNSKR